jgi:hypothetical protein
MTGARESHSSNGRARRHNRHLTLRRKGSEECAEGSIWADECCNRLIVGYDRTWHSGRLDVEWRVDPSYYRVGLTLGWPPTLREFEGWSLLICRRI